MLNIRDCPGRQVPDGAVYIGRTVSRAHLPGSKWGNPFKPAIARRCSGARGRRYAVSALAVRSAEAAGRAARAPRP